MFPIFIAWSTLIVYNFDCTLLYLNLSVKGIHQIIKFSNLFKSDSLFLKIVGQNLVTLLINLRIIVPSVHLFIGQFSIQTGVVAFCRIAIVDTTHRT